MIHKLNIGIHVLAGTIALLMGLVTLFYYQRPGRHKQFGRYFLYLLTIVVTTGFLGWLFFRSNSFLLMLTLLSGYVGYAGFRVIRLRENKGDLKDAMVSIAALSIGLLYAISLQQDDGWSPSLIYSTLSALILVTVYDLLKFFWLHDYLKTWWIYEHIYKMLSAFSAILSAFLGTLLPNFKPYSQIGPSVLGMGLIIFFIIQQARLRSKRRWHSI